MKVKAVFLEALDKHGPDEWGSYLDEACGEDREFRRDVQVLLDAHASDNSLLDKGAIATVAEAPAMSSAPISCWSRSARAGWASFSWLSKPSRSGARSP